MEKNRRFEQIILFCILFLILYGWGIFLNWGNIPFDFHDWGEVNVPRLAFLKNVVAEGKLPLHMQSSGPLRGITTRFMALPDVLLCPQLLLLKWLSIGKFILVDTWLLIIAGYFGLLKLKKHFTLSIPTFSWIVLLFFFNGHWESR